MSSGLNGDQHDQMLPGVFHGLSNITIKYAINLTPSLESEFSSIMMMKNQKTMPKVNFCQSLWNALQAPLAAIHGSTWRLGDRGQRAKIMNFAFDDLFKLIAKAKAAGPNKTPTPTSRR